LDRYALVLQGSHDVRIINKLLPLVAPVTHLTGGLAPRIGDSCDVATLMFVTATLGLELACAAGPGACALAISGWMPPPTTTFPVVHQLRMAMERSGGARP